MILLSIVTVVCLIRAGRAFPRGAPAEACESLLPRHFGTEPKDPQHSPYSFLASSSHYHYRMEGIQVQLTGPRFKGFLIAAMDPDTHERIGHWYKVKGTKTLPCSAISHGDPLPKKRVILLWKPPKDRPKGEVIFVATVLQSYGNYYSGIVAGIPPSEEHEDEHEGPY
ncbi:reelin domain-containing protein 1-like [Stegodyphus dumicola]|uniref:reelin domain-containing protein 1-like n=1 Tax=Stegodyphus dumicola TaxID=202533 RepID=UPI0015B178FB|nr:reelin domain-containing protein 1-like [Stegodyphus dumicola]